MGKDICVGMPPRHARPARFAVKSDVRKNIRVGVHLHKDLDNGTCSKTLTGHGHDVKALCCIGGTLYSKSDDKTIRSWQLESGGLIRPLIKGPYEALKGLIRPGPYKALKGPY